LAPAIEKVFNDIGGFGSFVKRGDRVLLKPNLLKSAAPSAATVTHPAVVETVASMVRDCGARPYVGDSPPLGSLERVMVKSGYGPLLKRLDVEIVPFTEKRTLDYSDGRLFRRVDVAQQVFEFDAIVNLPKLKTHTQMFLTLAVKNLFGTVIGTDKASWHLRAGRDVDTFATVLVQIYEKVKPTVSLIDGILGMEGNGPNRGDPRHVGILGASIDAVALDAVLCRLLGFKPETLLTCVIGEKLGVGVADVGRIEVKGDELTGFPLRDFKPPESATITWNLAGGNPIRTFLENYMITRPAIDGAACLNCGVCRDHCPPRAISEMEGIMVIDRKKCISCFCCHELCGNDAVRIVQPWFGRILGRITR